MKIAPLVTIAAILALGGASFAADGGKTASKPDPPTGAALARLSESAATASEHAVVARAFRLRAEELNQAAEEFEVKAAEMQGQPKIGMSSKWPSMSRDSLQRNKRKAVETRRMAREASDLSRHHAQLAVEKGFGGGAAADGTVEALILKPSTASRN